MKHTITHVDAQEILDSRGMPTIAVSLTLSGGAHAVGQVPSGASTGIHEACELRDGDTARYSGRGVIKAISHVVGEIREAVIDKNLDQRELDTLLCELDGSENKSRLGANAILGVSLAFARAAALCEKKELYEYIGALSGISTFALPTPAFNIINGGKHADNGLDFQECMVVPVGPVIFSEKLRAGSEVVMALKSILNKKGLSTGVGDEGGFAPVLSGNKEAFTLLEEAIAKAGYTKEAIGISSDIAASSFYADGMYHLHENGTETPHTTAQLLEHYKTLLSGHHIISIEDPFAEDDWEGFASFTNDFKDTCIVVGDDLTVTNTKRIEEAHEKHAITSVLIKPNQIGTISETLDAIAKTREYGWAGFMSHRSGETTDDSIADIAVGAGCTYIKSGAPVRGERVAKYNRLLEIEQKILMK
jgi:enolase